MQTPLRKSQSSVGASHLPLLPAILGLLALCIGAGSPAAAQAPRGAYVIAATWQSSLQPRPADSWPAASGLAIDGQKRIYVADAEDARIAVLDPGGAWRVLGDGADLGLVEPRDLAIDRVRERLYVADPGLGGIALLGLDGAPIGVWTGVDAKAGLALGPDGRVYAGSASQAEVLRFEPDGSPLSSIRLATGPVAGGGPRIRGLDVSADGTLAVLDGGSPILHRFDSTGRRLDPIELPAVYDDVIADFSLGVFTREWYWFTSASGLHHYDPLRDEWQHNPAVRGLDRLALYPPLGLVASQAGGGGASRVHRFEYGFLAWSGPPAESWGQSVEIPGRLESPERIELGADGRFYLLDRWPRAQVFDPAGNVLGQRSLGFLPSALAAGPDGRILASEGNSLRMLEVSGATAWNIALGPNRATTALAYLPGSDRFAALDPASGRILRFSPTGREEAGIDLPDPPSGEYIWADLAAGPDGSLHALDLRGPLLVDIAADGGIQTIPADLNARRIALRGDGLRLLLGRDGWIRGLDAEGRLQLAFDASRPDLAPSSRPADLAVDTAGDVYVVDRVAESVTRYTWDPDAEPALPPDAEPSCLAEGDKTAAPAEIQLGETVEVTLQAGGDCRGAVATVPLDILLLLDRSGSMRGEPIATAREAALEFVAAADLASARIGLVSFANQARQDAALTHDAWRLRQALGDFSLAASGGTDIAAALATGNDIISREGRLSARWVFILLSDGGSEHAPAIAQAERARAAGVEIFTIGIEADGVLLRAIAADAAHFFASSRLRELFAVFADIGRRIEAPALYQRLDLTDQLPDDMEYLAGSAEPPPFAIDLGPPATLRWQLEGLPAEGALIRYRLRPRQTGLRPTNIRAWADYVDGFGRPGRLDFPVPEVRVIGPTATASAGPPTATSPPLPTLRATTRPGPSPSPQALFLPLLLRERCQPGARHADVVLVIDSSGSMQGAKLAAAKAAALQLVDLLDLPADQAAVVAFDQEARRMAPLGASRAGIAAALAGLESRVGTRIDRGIALAMAELLGPRARAANTPTLVLLSDGAQSESPELALARAAEARAARVQIHAIGLGGDVDRAVLVALAGAPQRAYLAPGPEDLGAIYRAVAGRIPCPAEDFWGGR